MVGHDHLYGYLSDRYVCSGSVPSHRCVNLILYYATYSYTKKSTGW